MPSQPPPSSPLDAADPSASPDPHLPRNGSLTTSAPAGVFVPSSQPDEQDDPDLTQQSQADTQVSEPDSLAPQASPPDCTSIPDSIVTSEEGLSSIDYETRTQWWRALSAEMAMGYSPEVVNASMRCAWRVARDMARHPLAETSASDVIKPTYSLLRNTLSAESKAKRPQHLIAKVVPLILSHLRRPASDSASLPLAPGPATLGTFPLSSGFGRCESNCCDSSCRRRQHGRCLFSLG